MSFLTPTLLAGMALIGLPIALHLAMRHEPQRLVFPAMRLLKRRRQQNETRLRLRRWLLLLLRCAVVALLALALARPLLRPPGASGTAKLGEGLAVAMVFDNGPNMLYRSNNQTRLEVAQETATWLLNRFPADTQVVITDRRSRAATTVDDPDSAALRTDRLVTADATRPLGAALRDAFARLEDLPAGRQEVYLFTDRSLGVWSDATLEQIADELEPRPGVALHLIDVGIDDPQDLAVIEARPEREALATGEPLRLRVAVRATGSQNESSALQLWMLQPGPEGLRQGVKRDERPVVFGRTTNPAPADSPKNQPIRDLVFTVNGLDEGFQAGWVQIASGDPLLADDRRSFCVEVRPAPKVLLVAERPEQTLFVREAIAPIVPGGVAPYAIETIQPGAISRLTLEDYAAVLLLDPPPMDDRAWQTLTAYAESGGSVGLFLGRRATLDHFNGPVAQALLPATLKWRSHEPTYLRPLDYSHPAVALLADYAEAVPWAAFPVFQRWTLGSVRETAQVVIAYADGQPALVDQALGQGRVLLMTTPLSDALNEPEPWNLLPTGEDPWPFVLLANGLADYLGGSQTARLNYRAGEAVVAPLPVGFEAEGYVLRLPSGDAVRQSLLPGRKELIIGSADGAGVYQIESGGQTLRTFAMNRDPDVGQLERVPFEQIEARLGEGRVSLVHDRTALGRSIHLTRVGRELYPWAIALVVLCFTAEQVVSNRFYGGTDAVEV